MPGIGIQGRIARRGALAAFAAFAAAAALVGGRVAADDSLKAHGPIAWTDNYQAATKRAAKEKKPIMIDFWATWCGPCKQMLATTYKDKRVVARAKGFVPVLIDVDKQQALAQKYNVSAIPTIVFLDSKGKVISQNVGAVPPDKFLAMMNEASHKAH